MTEEGVKRLNYYNRQYLGFKDFRDEQKYHIEMRRRHNIAHHSWGIVVGLKLEEKKNEGQDVGVDVYIQPGMAVDGFGREILVLQPYKLDPALFDTFTDKKHREVWMAYDEEYTQNPSPGYEVCGIEEQYTRVLETYRILVGPQEPIHDPVIVDGRKAGVPPNQGYWTIPTDESVPYQELLYSEKEPRWLVKVGNVHWDGVNQKFVEATQGQLHEGRRYIGNVTAKVLAPVGELRIKDRNTETPLQDGKEGVAVTLEGSLQVDRKLTTKNDVHIDGTLTLGPSGNELFRGDDPGTKNPITGEPNNGLLIQSAQTVEVNIDSNDIPSDMFAVTKGSTREELFRIQEDGNVGIGTTSPTGKLQINGSAADAKIKFGGSGGDVHHISSKREIVFNTGNSGTSPAFVFRRTDFDNLSDYTDLLWVLGNGNVGIGTKSPNAPLEIKVSDTVYWARGLKIYSPNIPDGRRVLLHIGKEDSGRNTAEFGYYHDSNNSDLNRLTLGLHGYGEIVSILRNGNVGIGTTSPTGKLQINGTLTLGPSGNELFRGDDPGTKNPITGEPNNGLLIQSAQTVEVNIDSNDIPSDMFAVTKGSTREELFRIQEDGNIGIGTTSPGKKLDVNGDIQTDNIYLNDLDINCNKSLYLNYFSGRQVIVSGDLTVRGDLAVDGSKSGYVTDRFINKSGDNVEQGDVIVLGRSSAEVCYGSDDNIPVPEVDLSTTVYDHRICGIVAELLVEEPTPRREKGITASNRPEEKSFEMQKTKSMAKAEAGNDDGVKRLQVFSDEELSKLDRKKISSGQIGKMVTLGCFAHCKVDADIAPIKVGDMLTTSPLKGHAQKVLEPEKAVGAIIGKALGSLKKGKGKIPVLVMMQ